MKILMMDTIKPPGGDGSTIHRWELAKNLAKLGCEIYAISYTNISPGSVHIHSVPKKSKIGYTIQLLKLVMTHRFDIVYTRNILKAVIGILIKNVRKSKLILEVNGISPDEWRLVEKQILLPEKQMQ